MSSNPPTPHHHPTPLLTLLPHLLPHLPYSLPLLRLLQHHPSSATTLTLATIPPSTPSTPPFPNHFAALTVDLSSVETNCWVFSTFESSGRRSLSGQLDMRGRRARGNMLALLGEVRARLLGEGVGGQDGCDDNGDGRRWEGSGRFLIIGTLNETLLGLIGGEEVWGLKGEEVLTRGGYSERAQGWLERERERLRREGRKQGEEGVVAGVSIPYVKWIILPAAATVLPATATATAIAAGGDMGIIPESISGTDEETNFDDGDGGGGGGGGRSNNTNDNLDGGGITVIKGTNSMSTQTPSPSINPHQQTKPLLPQGGNYFFSKVRQEEFQTVIRRTKIPRTEETLAQLGNVAVRYRRPSSPPPPPPRPSLSLSLPATITANPTTTKPSQTTTITTSTATAANGQNDEQAATPVEEEQDHLIAWAFLGLDGSLSSLHVEPPHRGRGIAKAITRKLVENLALDPLEMGFRTTPLADDGEGNGDGWVSADVAVTNEESKGVVRGVGGKEGWRVRWVSVDLERVGMVAGGVG